MGMEDMVGAEQAKKAQDAQQKIREAITGLRADLAVMAMSYNLGIIYQATLAPKGVSRSEFTVMLMRAVEEALGWDYGMPKESAKPNKSSPWR